MNQLGLPDRRLLHDRSPDIASCQRIIVQEYHRGVAAVARRTLVLRGVYRMGRFGSNLAILLGMELPDPVFVGIVMMLVGSVLVVASLILERIHDARLEAEMLDE